MLVPVKIALVGGTHGAELTGVFLIRKFQFRSKTITGQLITPRSN